MIVLGIDPGAASGALAVLDSQGPAVLAIEDMPRHVRSRGKGTTSVVSAGVLADLLRPLGVGQAVIERVQAMPGQGATSGFQFGRSVGAVEGVLAALGIGLMEIEPVQWKRAVGLRFGADKDASRELAARLYPKHASTFARKRDDGRAEAVLIATAALRLW